MAIPCYCITSNSLQNSMDSNNTHLVLLMGLQVSWELLIETELALPQAISLAALGSMLRFPMYSSRTQGEG